MDVDPIGGLAGLAAVALTGLIKKGAGAIDGRIAEVVKPVQPWVALGLSVGLPIAAQQLGVNVDPQAFAQAPVATLAAIGLREVYAKLKPVPPR